jgi:hypothetical protein
MVPPARTMRPVLVPPTLVNFAGALPSRFALMRCVTVVLLTFSQ